MSDITYTKHGDKRVNNPTIDNRGFFVAEEQKPHNALYSRDPSLDTQHAWKGKDERDAEHLAVEALKGHTV